MKWLPECRKTVNTSIRDIIIVNTTDIDKIIERVRPAIERYILGMSLS